MELSCLLLHGLGGTPFEMEPLAVALREIGCSVHLSMLPGHGGTVEAYGAARFRDWTAHVEAEYRALEAEERPVLVAGFSLGGILALHLAQRFAVAGVAALAAPVFLFRFFPWFVSDWRLCVLPLLARTHPVMDVPPRRPEAREIAPWQGHEEVIFPAQVLDVMRGAAAVRRELRRVRAPLLLVQARGDKTCHPYNAWYIASRSASRDVALRLLDIREQRAGRHMITTHRETREITARAVASFARRVAVAHEPAGRR